MPRRKFDDDLRHSRSTRSLDLDYRPESYWNESGGAINPLEFESYVPLAKGEVGIVYFIFQEFVIGICARRKRTSKAIHYRVLDLTPGTHESWYKGPREDSPGPLSMREIVEFINDVRVPSRAYENERVWGFMPDMRCFVVSPLYPGLEEYYEPLDAGMWRDPETFPSDAPRIPYNRYEIFALARGQIVLDYRESYQEPNGEPEQGECVLLSYANGIYYVYSDRFCLCSECNEWPTWEDRTNGLSFRDFVPDSREVRQFIERVPPCVEIAAEAARDLVLSNGLTALYPPNTDPWFSGIEYAAIIEEHTLLIKSREKVITAREILGIRNAERRREAVQRYGSERFVDQIEPRVIAMDGDNQLLQIPAEPEPLIYLYLKDVSTARRYLLRVPPTVGTVQEGLAWSFHLEPEEYIIDQEA